MKTKASHDGLFCELYWGTTRNEAWNFGPEQTRVLAAPDETVALPLYGFTLPEEPFLLAERTAAGYRIFIPPASRVERSQKGGAFLAVSEPEWSRAGASAWVDLTPEDRLRLTQGALSLLLAPSVAGKRAGGLSAKDLGLLGMLITLLLSIPVGLLFAGHSPERMAESNARALAAAREKEQAERKRLGVDTPARPRAPEGTSDAGVKTLPGNFGTH
ncbi:MAG: hypothetical protein ABW123_08905 [Cystobacter sp.]